VPDAGLAQRSHRDEPARGCATVVEAAAVHYGQDAGQATADARPAHEAGADSGRGRARIVALDLFRVVVVAFVVAVHTLSFGTSTTGPVGAFVTVFHTSRELFFLLTAFVLTYNYGRRDGIRWLSFWRRRYALVVPAYLAWSLIYFLFDHMRLDPVTGALAHFGRDLATGDARYQLYFLLVTMQVYLAFPLLRGLLRKTEGHHLALLAIAAGYQVALTLAIQHRLVMTGPVGSYLHDPDIWLTSYPLYVLAGAVAAWHFDRLAAFTRRHYALALPAFAVGLGAGLSGYFLELTVGGQSPVTASAVFQPAVVVESLCFGWALLALALRWADRGARGRTLVGAGADGSFGIFLAHPLVLQGALALAGATGVLAALHAAPVGVQLVALLLLAVPLVYLLSGLLVVIARRTPLSLPLTGRRVHRRHQTQPAQATPAASPAPPPTLPSTPAPPPTPTSTPVTSATSVNPATSG
jgi:peptidoglycan/LPS O-acetylase OafA/YrhL